MCSTFTTAAVGLAALAASRRRLAGGCLSVPAAASTRLMLPSLAPAGTVAVLLQQVLLLHPSWLYSPCSAVLFTTVPTDRASATLLAPLLPPTMLTDSASTTLLALAPLAAMLTYAASTALFANTPPSAMLADPTSAAILAVASLAAMLADRASATLLALFSLAAMFADPASTTLPAVCVPLAVVAAEDVPMAVPVLCTAAALGVAAAAAAIVVAADTCASAAPAAESTTEMPRQTADQILLLPGLRQLKSGAQLLQLGHGLRERGHTNQTQRELVTS